MIEFHHVAKQYPNGFEALKHINFSLAPGEMTFLTGHSGAGKSTLLKLLMLMERPTHGSVVVAGQDLGKLNAARIPYYRRHIGVVFQDHQLLPDRSVFDNVALPLHIAGYAPKDIGRRVRAALDKVGLLDKEKTFPLRYPAVKDSVWVLRAPWSIARPFYWPMNPPATSTLSYPQKSCVCLAISVAWALRC